MSLLYWMNVIGFIGYVSEKRLHLLWGKQPILEGESDHWHGVRVGFRLTQQASAWAEWHIQRFSIHPISFLISFSYTNAECMKGVCHEHYCTHHPVSSGAYPVRHLDLVRRVGQTT